jgi:hypothetical protein
MKKILKHFFTLIFFFHSFNSQSQSYNLESIQQSKLRNLQLLDIYDSTVSFNNLSNRFLLPSNLSWKKSTTNVLPIVLFTQFNSNKQFGWNDGPMQQSIGYQIIARPGLNVRYGIFEVQAAPEFLYINRTNFTKVFSGQSFLKLHLGSLSFGISSENLWWGPGIQCALLMSNNAPGFKHIFIGTNKPIKTPIGHFEFNLIGAKLTSDKNLPYENNNNQIRNINDEWRYLNAYVVSWQPKWVKGLFLGMTRSLQQYGERVQKQKTGFGNKYLPVLGLAIQKTNNLGDDSLDRDQLVSFFLRWVLPKSNAEFYVEYGKNDYGINIRDYLMAPSHSYAYTIGFRKLLPRSKEEYVQLEGELTQISQSPDAVVRTAGNWYVHSQIFQGYTHQNQIIGAGAGFGANVQTVSANWIKGEIRNGFLIQRVERDPEGRANKWTDLSIGWMPQWKYKNMLLGAKVQLIRSNNYNWEKGMHSFNLHSRLMIQYNFK